MGVELLEVRDHHDVGAVRRLHLLENRSETIVDVQQRRPDAGLTGAFANLREGQGSRQHIDTFPLEELVELLDLADQTIELAAPADQLLEATAAVLRREVAELRLEPLEQPWDVGHGLHRFTRRETPGDLPRDARAQTLERALELGSLLGSLLRGALGTAT